mgnify:CR=1 FL=1
MNNFAKVLLTNQRLICGWLSNFTVVFIPTLFVHIDLVTTCLLVAIYGCDDDYTAVLKSFLHFVCRRPAGSGGNVSLPDKGKRSSSEGFGS